MPDEAKADLPAKEPVSTPAAPTSPPAPVVNGPTAEEVITHNLLALADINRLVAKAFEFAASRLRRPRLDGAARLCLLRVQAIIAYGANQHHQADETIMERLLNDCQRLQERHHREVRSGKPLWFITVPGTKSNPYAAFQDLLKYQNNGRKEACKLFARWSRMVDDADHAARNKRTLE